jgi:hypothetical protein
MTCVTAFYNIGRNGVDGRSLTDYKQWLLSTLTSVTSPMILFLDITLGWKDEILSARTEGLHIIETPLSDIIMWKHRERITQILNDPAFKAAQKYPTDITNRLPEYCMIQYSKFGFLEWAIKNNPFKSEYFCWMDAGISRFFEPNKAYTLKTDSLAPTFYIQSDIPARRRLNIITPDTYIGTNECILKGGIWVMGAASFDVVRNEVMHILNEEMLSKGRIDNEQIALALAYRKVSQVFNITLGRAQIDGILQACFTQTLL